MRQVVELRNWFCIETARQKIETLPAVIRTVLNDALNEPLQEISFPSTPGRDVQILDIKKHPPKAGLNKKEGQIRLLHDLANIELQAMELAVRTLIEFQDVPEGFQEELAEIALEESKHLKSCLDGMIELGGNWGDFPVGMNLWEAVHKNILVTEGDFLGRIMLVHRYMEATGLDAGERLMTRLSGVRDIQLLREILQRIVKEEVGHVSFGSKWYHRVCEIKKVDPYALYQSYYSTILLKMPRTEKPAYQLRSQAGFHDRENEITEHLLKTTDFQSR